MTESVHELVESIESNHQKEINDLIVSYSAKSSAIAAIPIPLVDTAGLIIIQMRLVDAIAEIHNVSVDERGKLIMSSIISAVVGKMLTEATVSLAKTVSIGQLLSDTLVKAAISGFVTTISGEVYDYHFRNGGSVESLSVETYMDYLTQQIKSDRLTIDSLGTKFIESTMSKFGINN